MRCGTIKSDDEAVVKQLLKSSEDSEAPDCGRDDGRSNPGGAIPTSSKFYIPRPSDDALAQALRRKDTIVLIKGGRQMGKTSLVARGLQQARASGATVVYTDLQKLNNSDLANIQPFYISRWPICWPINWILTRILRTRGRNAGHRVSTSSNTSRNR